MSKTATQGPPSATTSLENWNVDGNYVERLMDNAPFLSADPENTLVLAGPPRFGSDSTFNEKLLPIGMLQSFQSGQQRPIIPMPSIGTRRQFYLTGRSQNNFSIARLFVNGRNLLRVLMNHAIALGIAKDLNVKVDVDGKADDSAPKPDHPFIMNLDSELFSIPFGLGVVFKDKGHRIIGGLYMELAMFANWSLGVNAGQNHIVEGVSGLYDRAVPFMPDFATKIKKGASNLAQADIDIEKAFGSNYENNDNAKWGIR